MFERALHSQVAHVEGLEILLIGVLEHEVLLGCVDGSHCLQGLTELTHFGVEQTQFEHVLGQEECHVVHLAQLAKPLQESVRGGETDVEVQGKEYFLLGIQDLLACILALGDVHEVLEQRRVDLFVLSHNEEGCDGDQLDFSLGDLVETEIPIDDVDGQEEGLWEQFEVVVDFDEPVDHGGPDGLVDLDLHGHVGGV